MEDPVIFERFCQKVPFKYKVRNVKDRAVFIDTILFLGFLNERNSVEGQGVRFSVVSREMIIYTLCYLFMDPDRFQKEEVFYSTLRFHNILRDHEIEEFLVTRPDNYHFKLFHSLDLSSGGKRKTVDTYFNVYLDILEPLFECHFYYADNPDIRDTMVFGDTVIFVGAYECDLPLLTYIKDQKIADYYRNYLQENTKFKMTEYIETSNSLEILEVFLEGKDYYYFETNSMPTLFMGARNLAKVTGNDLAEPILEKIDGLYERLLYAKKMNIVVPMTLFDDFIENGVMNIGYEMLVVPEKDRLNLLRLFLETVLERPNINIYLTTKVVDVPISFSEKGLVDIRVNSYDHTIHKMDFKEFNEPMVLELFEKMENSSKVKLFDEKEYKKFIKKYS